MAETYTIVGQGQGQAVGPTGGLVDVWRATVATIPEGTRFSVDVPLAEWLSDPSGSVASRAEPIVSAVKQTQAL